MRCFVDDMEEREDCDVTHSFPLIFSEEEEEEEELRWEGG